MPRRIKIWVKLSLFLTFVLIVSLGILALITWVFMQKLLTDELQDSLVSLNGVRQQQVRSYLLNQLDSVQLVASRVTLKQLVLKAETRDLTDKDIASGNYDLQSAIASLRGFVSCNVYNTSQLLFTTNTTQAIRFFTTHHATGITGTFYNSTKIFLQITQVFASNTPNSFIQCVTNAQQLWDIVQDDTSLGPSGQVAIGFPGATPGMNEC